MRIIFAHLEGDLNGIDLPLVCLLAEEFNFFISSHVLHIGFSIVPALSITKLPHTPHLFEINVGGGGGGVNNNASSESIAFNQLGNPSDQTSVVDLILP